MLFKVVTLALLFSCLSMSIGFSAADKQTCKNNQGQKAEFDRKECSKAAERLAEQKPQAECGLCAVSLKDMATGKLVTPKHKMDPTVFSKEINSILDHCKDHKRMRRATPMEHKEKDPKAHPDPKYMVAMMLDTAKTNSTC